MDIIIHEVNKKKGLMREKKLVHLIDWRNKLKKVTLEHTHSYGYI